jgi:hypothetical protein
MEAPADQSETCYALCFGMVYSKEQRQNTGQPYRDRVRCDALERLLGQESNKNYKVFSCDVDHEDHHFEDLRKTSAKTGVVVHLEQHIFGNFNSSRRMFASMKKKWGDNIKFDKVYWDWFFCTVSVYLNNN